MQDVTEQADICTWFLKYSRCQVKNCLVLRDKLLYNFIAVDWLSLIAKDVNNWNPAVICPLTILSLQ